MRRQVGHIEIETIGAERSKFTAPMILIHGLWCTSTVWRRAMGYLAHRGWDCHAVNLRGRTGRKTGGAVPRETFTLQDHVADLNAVIATCELPPVVVGHDLGGLLALSREIHPVRAAVAIAPLVPVSLYDDSIPGITDLRTRLAMKLRGYLPPPGGRTRLCYFGSNAPQPLVGEPSLLGRQLADAQVSFPLRSAIPTLVVAGDADAVTPLAGLSKVADSVGADLHHVHGGHSLPWESGWQDCVTDIHRWLIRTLGDSLLALLDEEEEN